MIKIDKDLDIEKIPKSLKSGVTEKRRNEIIVAQCYPNNTTINRTEFTSKNVSTYDSRYKHKDIKEKLNQTYKYKCCYCEQRIEQYHVEHYRPKSIYYWLSYSWDNLMLCCPKCNELKSNNFKVKKKVKPLDFDITNIHNLQNKYNEFEKPELVNPENEDIYDKLVFEKNGNIKSNNKRVKHTIDVCQLDRTWLNEQREELYNEFEQKIFSRKEEERAGDKEAAIKLKGFIEDFINENKEMAKEYISFRKFILKTWLRELIN